MDTTRDAVRPREMKTTALIGSAASLCAPVVLTHGIGVGGGAELQLLVWLPALVPAFLLTYVYGWTGSAAALLAGAAVVVATGGAASEPLRAAFVAVLAVVALGSGVLAALFRDALEAAERSSLTDPGTGLANRRHGMIHLHRAFAAASRGAPLSVVMFDLDRFKQVNDRFGHATGDEVLRVFARILADRTRAMNLSVRFGGEEFMAVLDGEHAEGAAVMAERAVADMRAHEFPWGRVTVSAGISEYEEGMASPDVLIAAADQALYRAKARGGDRVVALARQGADAGAVLPATDEPPAAAGGDGELILIVDDDEAVLRTLSRGLVRRGYCPIEASDPNRALELVRELDEPLDLVVTDLVMPAMSGFRLVEMLQDTQPDLRALYISGYSSDEVRWSGVPGTVRAFLPKPLELATFAAAVQRVLAAPAPIRVPEPSDDPPPETGHDGGHDVRWIA